MAQSNVNMRGKVVLITGGTAGIGKATSEALAAMGATVVIVSRDLNKGQAVVREIKDKTGNSSVTFLQADLSSQAEIHKVAEEFKSQFQNLHVLINNAGGMFMQRKLTVDGLEYTFAFNHLAYFLLTNLLLDVLKASTPARIINVSSGSHYGGKIDFDDLRDAKGYAGMRAYSESKLANVLFTFELAKRLQGTGVTANVLHPGVVTTGFNKNNGSLMRFGMSVLGHFLLTPEQGAQTTIYLASSPEVEGVTGKYFDKSKEKQPAELANDSALAQRLWKVSEDLTHLVPQTSA